MAKCTQTGVLVAALATLIVTSAAWAQTAGDGERAHPPIAHAIHVLEDAIAHMEASPSEFGGHRERAISASRKAVRELRDALFDRQGGEPHEHKHRRH